MIKLTELPIIQYIQCNWWFGNFTLNLPHDWNKHIIVDLTSLMQLWQIRHWILAGLWFSPDTPASSTNKIDHHDITEILLKMALNTITVTHSWNQNWPVFLWSLPFCINFYFRWTIFLLRCIMFLFSWKLRSLWLWGIQGKQLVRDNKLWNIFFLIAQILI
jgi:hypothetical protein